MPRKGPPTTMEMGFDMKLPILASERPGPSHMGILGPFPIVKSGEREITERPRSKIVRLSNSGRFGVWLWDRWSVRSITAPSCPSNSQSLLINSVFGYALPMNVPSPVLGQVYPGGIFSQPFDQQAVVEIKVNLGETLLVPSYWDTLFAQGIPKSTPLERNRPKVNPFSFAAPAVRELWTDWDPRNGRQPDFDRPFGRGSEVELAPSEWLA
ncbi:hypothetical protein OAory_01110820 [Aspergillus oryzae]|uniref:Uncharacterized protein n=1 Tax=Aspergillus oryzae TaxID=5062 RepID=A0A1S9D6M5_ASPOZ|nr:hypothetical protein OAory_01110820 [Aspergillus oryzae]